MKLASFIPGGTAGLIIAALVAVSAYTGSVYLRAVSTTTAKIERKQLKKVQKNVTAAKDVRTRSKRGVSDKRVLFDPYSK